MLDFTSGLIVLGGISVFFLFYVYIGYAQLLRLLSLAVRNGTHEAVFPPHERPTLTVLLTVFNEEDKIIPRLQNIFACSYPEDKLSILVASDGSTDATETLVDEFKDDRVSLIRHEGRGEDSHANLRWLLLF